jgi:hypothetical protein
VRKAFVIPAIAMLPCVSPLIDSCLTMGRLPPQVVVSTGMSGVFTSMTRARRASCWRSIAAAAFHSYCSFHQTEGSMTT